MGKFDAKKKIQDIQELKKEGVIRENSVYHYMNEDDIQRFWKKRARDGTKIHNLIENYFRYKQLFTNKVHPLYKDFEKFLRYYDKIRKDGWKLFVPEFKIYCDDPFIGGMIDLLTYRKNESTGEYEYMLVDWK
ncbi:unnamed protein product, partial [marine sediment metagenome]